MKARVGQLLQLPCLAIIGAWLMRPQTSLSRSLAGNNSVKTVLVDLHLPPTPMLSYRESTDLPGSPSWQRRVERLHLLQSVGSTAAPLPAASNVSQPDTRLHVSPEASLNITAAANNTPSSPSLLRTPSAVKRGVLRRQSPPARSSCHREVASLPALQLDFCKTPEPKEQQNIGRNSLLPTITGYRSAEQLLNSADAVSPVLDDSHAGDNESSRWLNNTLR